MTMRALVTGGAGFIGSHVADGLLGAGYDVLAMAIDERNELTVRVSGLALPGAAGDFSLVVEGEGLSELPTDKRNVMAGAIVRGLDARALVISSTGPHFTAGMDLSVFSASSLGTGTVG